MGSYYFDTNALIYYYVGSDNSRTQDRLRQLIREHTMYVSSLTAIEYIQVLLKKQRKKELRRAKLQKLIKHLKDDLQAASTSPVHFAVLRVPEDVFKRAETLLLQHERSDVGVIDCLHIAIVEKERDRISDLTLVTSDKGIKDVCDVIKLPVFDPLLES
jgi:predicted nucleic acid-binding protein